MSHFSKIKTHLTEQTYLLQALDDLKLSYKTGDNLNVYGHQGEQPVDIRIETDNQHGIGFHQQDGIYLCIADFWGTGWTQERFLGDIQQRYAYHAAKSKLEAQGFSLVEEQQEGQRLHLRLRRMV